LCKIGHQEEKPFSERARHLQALKTPKVLKEVISTGRKKDGGEATNSPPRKSLKRSVDPIVCRGKIPLSHRLKSVKGTRH